MRRSARDQLADPRHPIWKIGRVASIALVLLAMQLLTATHYDLALDGEAGTLGIVALIHAVLEYRR